MIKLKLDSFNGCELKFPKDIYVWLAVREVGDKKLSVLATCHASINEAKTNMEKVTDKMLSVMAMLPPSEQEVEAAEVFTGDFRLKYHELMKAKLEATNLYSDVTIIL